MAIPGLGSSPLTRGKRCNPAPRRRSCRLIPAHAGKTPPAPGVEHPLGAHPRSRGENTLMLYTGAAVVGSSPLTRGKRAHDTRFRRAVGLIPAHAGKTRGARPTTYASAAHPRSRGENRWLHSRHTTRAGSSPLTRGKLSTGSRVDATPRLIPAHAGKTRRPGPDP